MKQPWICLIYFFIPQIVVAQAGQVAGENPVSILWDQTSLKQVSPSTASHPANYARMIQLSNGHLLCVYEGDAGIVCTISNDLGNSWLQPVIVAGQVEGVNMAVPDVMELPDKSLLVAYNPRPHKVNGAWDTTRHFAIRTKKSNDQGKTWREERLIYEAGYRFEDGCWEPALLQLPSGEIQLYFSDEGIYTKSNEQNISIFRSVDKGLSWSRQPTIVSFTPAHRDGMPIPILLQGKAEIAFSIEDNVRGQFKPAIIRNGIDENWQRTVGGDDVKRIAALLFPLPDTVYAGAPYLRQLHSGATILSYQSNMNRRHPWELSCMQVAVGNSDAKNFENVAAPFKIPLDKHGLWNSLCVLEDDTIIAVTSTDAYSAKTAIWMIKGKLIRTATE